MRIAFLYNDPCEDPTFEAEEVDPAASPIVSALQNCGHDVTPLACTLDFAALRQKLLELNPDVAFNRVESLGGSDAMMGAIPMLLELLRIPYTGCSAEPQLATANKVVVKQRLLSAGLPTPAWATSSEGLLGGSGRNPRRFIIKSTLEHASLELDGDSVVDVSSISKLQHEIQARESRFGRPFFGEEFIEGREFNLALFGCGPTVLPPAEIDFSSFPVGKHRIVDYRAKCDDASFEYHHTPRRFDFPPSDSNMISRLIDCALDAWRLFRLLGYARVDFRCDQHGRPWILEINTNACLSPSAGFAGALAAAGISYEQGLQLILDDAIQRAPQERLNPQRASSACAPHARSETTTPIVSRR